jgi:hypothetical protein
MRGLAALLFLRAAIAAATPAFPGAEGAGAWASGGRGGEVYKVTNLNAAGPGSLADAVSRPNRTIVSTVSGAIDLASGKGRIDLAQPNITIAGPTAPGEGIAIIGGGLRVRAGNVIIRHIRVGRGWRKMGDSGDAIDVKGHFENVILGHVSAAWATAESAIAAEGLDYFNPGQSPNRHA